MPVPIRSTFTFYADAHIRRKRLWPGGLLFPIEVHASLYDGLTERAMDTPRLRSVAKLYPSLIFCNVFRRYHISF